MQSQICFAKQVARSYFKIALKDRFQRMKVAETKRRRQQVSYAKKTKKVPNVHFLRNLSSLKQRLQHVAHISWESLDKIFIHEWSTERNKNLQALCNKKSPSHALHSLVFTFIQRFFAKILLWQCSSSSSLTRTISLAKKSFFFWCNFFFNVFFKN